MPAYVYKCDECGEARTVVLRLSELDNPQHCENPQCARTTPISRQPTSAALKFNGPGWTPRHYPS